MTDINQLFDDHACSTAPPSEEPQRVPQVRLAPAKQGPANERLLSVETGQIGGFARQRECARLDEIRREEAKAEADERKRKADATAAAEQRKKEADARKEAERIESAKRRERWRAEDGK
jgi:hypothetical protein